MILFFEGTENKKYNYVKIRFVALLKIRVLKVLLIEIYNENQKTV